MSKSSKCIDRIDRFYKHLIAELHDPESKLIKRITKQSHRRIYEVEVPPPWKGLMPWSSRYKDWEYTRGRLHRINQRLDQEMLFSRAWMEWDNDKLILCWLPRGILHRTSLRELWQ